MKPLAEAPYGEAVLEAARHSFGPVIYHEQVRDCAIAVMQLSDDYFWYLLFHFIGGEWLPADANDHGGFSPEGLTIPRITVTTRAVREPADRVRVGAEGDMSEYPVVDGFVTVLNRGLRSTRPVRYLALHLPTGWADCPLADVPATAAGFSSAFLSFCGAGDEAAHGWAALVFGDHDRCAGEERAAILDLVLYTISQADSEEDSRALGMLGAGPLSAMGTPWLVEQLRHRLPLGDTLRCALGSHNALARGPQKERQLLLQLLET